MYITLLTEICTIVVNLLTIIQINWTKRRKSSKTKISLLSNVNHYPSFGVTLLSQICVLAAIFTSVVHLWIIIQINWIKRRTPNTIVKSIAIGEISVWFPLQFQEMDKEPVNASTCVRENTSVIKRAFNM